MISLYFGQWYILFSLLVGLFIGLYGFFSTKSFTKESIKISEKIGFKEMKFFLVNAKSIITIKIMAAAMILIFSFNLYSFFVQFTDSQNINLINTEKFGKPLFFSLGLLMIGFSFFVFLSKKFFNWTQYMTPEEIKKSKFILKNLYFTRFGLGLITFLFGVAIILFNALD